MKLSSLIAYRNLLDQQSPQDTDYVIRSHIGPLLHAIDNHTVKFPDLYDQLQQDSAGIRESFAKFIATTRAIRSQVQQLIDQIEDDYYINSLTNYTPQYENNDYVLSRRCDLVETTHDYIRGRFKLYSDWRYPALVIRPGKENWIEDLVGSDPLYLLDHNLELLAPAVGRFNKEYQRRLRLYAIDESRDHVLADLPDGQFSLAVAFYFLNFKPLEYVSKYLSEMFDKLRPGGTAIITFNDCDIAGGVELVERNFMSYTPGHIIYNLAHNLGFEITQKYYLETSNVWLELRKPGRLSGIRGGQSLAKIVAKSK